MIRDPWYVASNHIVDTSNSVNAVSFEDNFEPSIEPHIINNQFEIIPTIPTTTIIPLRSELSAEAADAAESADLVEKENILPDSKEYLESLEKKLLKLKNQTNILDQLSARREQCMESLLRGSITLPTDADFGLLDSDTDESSTQPQITTDLIRHIIPEQAINPGELVHIIKYDQLE